MITFSLFIIEKFVVRFVYKKKRKGKDKESFYFPCFKKAKESN
jgi:hypothetical protein